MNKNVKHIIWCSLLLAAIPLHSAAYKVYCTTGHKCQNELLNAADFPTTSQYADGLWCMPWNFRNGLYDVAKTTAMINQFTSKQMVVEIEMGHFEKINPQTMPIQLDICEKAGAQVHTLMIYREGNNHGSMVTIVDIESIRNRYDNKYKLITNIRTWDPKNNEPILKKLDGCCFEFNCGSPTMNNSNTNRWVDVGEAVKWCLENDKMIYLLTPSGHKDNMTGEEIRQMFHDGYRDLVKYLETLVGAQKLRTSEKVVFIPSNYNFDKRPIHLSPESDPTTVTGVCKYLIDNRLKQFPR